MTALSILLFGLWMMILIVVTVRFVQTRDAGFVWLGLAFVGWPLMSMGLNVLFRRVIEQPDVRMPFGVTLGMAVALWSRLNPVITGLLALAGLLTVRSAPRSGPPPGP